MGYSPEDVLAGNLIGDEMPDIVLCERDGLPVIFIAIGDQTERMKEPPPRYLSYVRGLGCVQYVLTVTAGGLTGWELAPGIWEWPDLKPSLRLDLDHEEVLRPASVQALQRFITSCDQNRITRNDRQRARRRARGENGEASVPCAVRVWSSSGLTALLEMGESVREESRSESNGVTDAEPHGENSFTMLVDRLLRAAPGAVDRVDPESWNEFLQTVAGEPSLMTTWQRVAADWSKTITVSDRFEQNVAFLSTLFERGTAGMARSLTFAEGEALTLAWGVAGESDCTLLMVGPEDLQRSYSSLVSALGSGEKGRTRLLRLLSVPAAVSVVRGSEKA